MQIGQSFGHRAGGLPASVPRHHDVVEWRNRLQLLWDQKEMTSGSEEQVLDQPSGSLDRPFGRSATKASAARAKGKAVSEISSPSTSKRRRMVGRCNYATCSNTASPAFLAASPGSVA